MNKYAIGKCETMCPMEEMKMRQKEKLLHLFEMIPGTEKGHPLVHPERAVKMYNRSAAGKFMTNENHLRPPKVLLQTVKYLLRNVAKDTRYSWLMKYDFIADRLRAVRQDMIIQNIGQDIAIQLIEPMVRFYAFSSYWLCDEDVFHFDPYLNKKTLQECLNHLLILYRQVEKFSSGYEKNLLVHIDESKSFFEVLNYVLNLGNEEILFRLICLPEKSRTPLVKTAIMMGLNYNMKNFVKVYRFMQELPRLLAGIGALQLPILRRNTFQIMSTAYSSKNLKFPLLELKNLLCYESINDLMNDCKHYGLKVDSDFVHFEKSSFDDTAELIQPRKLNVLEKYFKNVNEHTFFMPESDVSVLSESFDLITL